MKIKQHRYVIKAQKKKTKKGGKEMIKILKVTMLAALFVTPESGAKFWCTGRNAQNN